MRAAAFPANEYLATLSSIARERKRKKRGDNNYRACYCPKIISAQTLSFFPSSEELFGCSRLFAATRCAYRNNAPDSVLDDPKFRVQKICVIGSFGAGGTFFFFRRRRPAILETRPKLGRREISSRGILKSASRRVLNGGGLRKTLVGACPFSRPPGSRVLASRRRLTPPF